MEMKIQYKKLEIWSRAYEFVVDAYHLLERLPESETNNIKQQLRRASTSLPLNIAEGAGSGSPRVFMTHLIYAYRSGCEVETLLMLCKDLRFLTEEWYDKLSSQLDLFMRKLCSYMRYLGKEYIQKSKNPQHKFYGEELCAIDASLPKQNSLASAN